MPTENIRQNQHSVPAIPQGCSAPTKQLSGVVFLLILIAALTGLAYSPAIQDAFLGDDFVHLTWLSEAVKHPELIWRNFYTSWLDGTTTKFYRPLISVFMVTDYLIYGPHGQGFRLTNLFFHLSSALLLFLITLRIQNPTAKTSITSTNLVWATFATAIFALYPLHPEAVSWTTGRVDTIVTTFCLLSIFGYLQWRAKQIHLWLYLSLIANMLGLLSKEMAITIPAICLGYEMLCYQPAVAKEATANDSRQIIKVFFRSLQPTLPFWFILAGYFGVRRLALGTFVGGYDDSLLFIANPLSFINNWLNGISMLLVPTNKFLLGAHNPLTKSWLILLALIGISLAGCLILVRERHRTFLFCIFWLFMSLAPVYKIFGIAADLEGSRLAYLCTAPLAVLMAGAFTGASDYFTSATLKTVFSQRIRTVFGTIFTLLCFTVLYINNQPWREASLESNRIRKGLEQLYTSIPGDPEVLLIGLPDHINGAYVCRNALSGMIKKPQFYRDIYNAVMIYPYEPIMPYGYLKDSIAACKQNVRIYFWNSSEKLFHPITVLPDINQNIFWLLQGQSLKKALDFTAAEKSGELKATWLEDGRLHLSTNNKPAAIFLQPGQHKCWSTDFIAMQVESHSIPAAPFSLFYKNDLRPQYLLSARTETAIKPEPPNQLLAFALRPYPEWGLGGQYTEFKLVIPAHADLTIRAISNKNPAELMPQISFPNSGYLGTKGHLELSNKKAVATIHVDASKITGATKCRLEITRVNLQFMEQNSQEFSNVALLKPELDTTCGDYSLRVNILRQPGLYQLRAWALDNAGKIIGVASDHININRAVE